NSDADILAAFTAWVNDKQGPKQASASFGECENIDAAEPVIGTDGLETPGDAVLKQAVIEGRTLFASTGDTGSSCPVVQANTGADQPGAGTSLSSPRWLGMWTRIQAAAAKKGLGFANRALYKIGTSAKYASDFFDVTVGNNQPYSALPGWDNVSGWGTPDVAHLMQDLT